jgi:hypothetical protein
MAPLHIMVYLPYDISLTINDKTQYIEVKSTRAYNQHIFPISINEIEWFLRHKENYFIYRVYTEEKRSSFSITFHGI